MIAAVILAAGASRRMGRPKLALPWQDDETIIGHVIRVFREAGATPIIVVSAAGDDILADELAGLDVVVASVPPGGEMLDSVKAGLSMLEDQEVDAALLAPGDHPLLAPETVRHLIDAWRAEGASIVAPSIGGRRGHPIMIDRSVWPSIASLKSDRSLRDLLRERNAEIRYVLVEDRGVIHDIDTPLDYERAREQADEGPTDREPDG